MKCLTGCLHFLDPQVAQPPVEGLLVGVVVLPAGEVSGSASWKRPTKPRSGLGRSGKRKAADRSPRSSIRYRPS
jgi:hypothetical protein